MNKICFDFSKRALLMVAILQCASCFQQKDTMQNKYTPEHLQVWRGLYVREGKIIKEAPKADVDLAKTYPLFKNKGEWFDETRITILTEEKTSYSIGDEIRIIHVVESVKNGYELYIMGPKTVYSEFVNGELSTEKVPDGREDPLIPLIYDGSIVVSPTVDYNYEITSYQFKEQGVYRIQWILGKLKSNIITVKLEQ